MMIGINNIGNAPIASKDSLQMSRRIYGGSIGSAKGTTIKSTGSIGISNVLDSS
jgi:hypothetical protein